MVRGVARRGAARLWANLRYEWVDGRNGRNTNTTTRRDDCGYVGGMRPILAGKLFLSRWLVLAACSNEGEPESHFDTDARLTESPDGGTGAGGGFDCTQQVAEVQGAGGCVLTIVSPANCETVDFGAGVVELAYTTNTTFCEGPHPLPPPAIRLRAGRRATAWTSH
jgi:hypothetical protein